MTYPVPRCRACTHHHFPPRAVCPRCGAVDIVEVEVAGGVVTASTERAHRQREWRRNPVRGWADRWRVPIAEILSDVGAVMIAWNPEDAGPGERVCLERESGVPVARRERS